MRIGVFFTKFPPTDGGGFTFENLVRDELLRAPSEHTFVPLFARPPSPAPQKQDPPTLFTRFGKFATRFYKSPEPPAAPKERTLAEQVGDEKLDLVFFPTPSFFDQTNAPFVYTLWDLQHRKQPYFPEVSTAGWTWEQREVHYAAALKKAAFIIVPNQIAADEVRLFYGIPQERMIINPHPCPRLVQAEEPIGDLRKFTYEPFYLYPAQFWAHKNHYTILEAIQKSKAQGRTIRFVFSGSDHGNQDHVLAVAKDLKVEDSVFFSGFVSDANLSWLYQNAKAMVYASLFGPENLPPLEAMSVGCPVICSDYDGAKVQLEDACLYFECLSSDSLCEKIKELDSNPGLRTTLVAAGHNLATKRTPKQYVATVLSTIDRFSLIRRNWR